MKMVLIALTVMSGVALARIVEGGRIMGRAYQPQEPPDLSNPCHTTAKVQAEADPWPSEEEKEK
jgi:hypothetical protein